MVVHRFTARIGVIFFETPLSQQAIMRARNYDLIITGSSWNEAVLRASDIVNVRTVLQGVDRSLFHASRQVYFAPMSGHQAIGL
jgi:hypothetical protein